MKKLVVLFILLSLCASCSKNEDYETIYISSMLPEEFISTKSIMTYTIDSDIISTEGIKNYVVFLFHLKKEKDITNGDGSFTFRPQYSNDNIEWHSLMDNDIFYNNIDVLYTICIDNDGERFYKVFPVAEGCNYMRLLVKGNNCNCTIYSKTITIKYRKGKL